jgi:hypothetical protein
MEQQLSITSTDFPTSYNIERNDTVLQKLPDPVSFLSPVLEIFVPIGNDETVTMLGLWFDSDGLLHIYVQQAIIPDNVFAQVKIITLKVPIAIVLTIFGLGLGLFFVRASILAFRAGAKESANQFHKS